MKTRWWVVVGLMVSMPVWAGEVKVDIKEFMFGPKDLAVTVGTKVTWVNDDQIPHTVAETHKAFRSGALDTNDSFSWVFTTPGEFEYFCVLHPQMIGKVVVHQ
ncbi:MULTISPECIES: plastocyanin/azurin family copper-binding protein [unclassified Pseudomonas]|uniref:plastocyanin/azurin family copper-binding protein n=1 Tax=unclassified Pseudomonas TaxID=196821 RepID=UPI002AC8EF23|nr:MULTISPECIES: plastocyanin/azurin family copper-binding protein [unclassified Pseudomonas]MEB0047816.1 plastocyanin/azurin family copper-binding protein [Pseudomonas sp. Dout3]MEB0098330.1 plastocyanin/azurin family copper-binding protein [Pseudomonas sp. DC1.2]WPX57118.1 plastocyanin/azurin family copper-binding protein [Pseudomonas sp. DC1.2]